MIAYFEKFERVAAAVLATMVSCLVTLAIGKVGWLIIREIVSPPVALLNADELLDAFGALLLVLVGIELIDTLKAYMREREVRAEIVILVALIALSQKILLLDLKTTSGISMVGIGAIILSLAVAYFCLRRTAHAADPE